MGGDGAQSKSGIGEDTEQYQMTGMQQCDANPSTSLPQQQIPSPNPNPAPTQHYGDVMVKFERRVEQRGVDFEESPEHPQVSISRSCRTGGVRGGGGCGGRACR